MLRRKTSKRTRIAYKKKRMTKRKQRKTFNRKRRVVGGGLDVGAKDAIIKSITKIKNDIVVLQGYIDDANRQDPDVANDIQLPSYKEEIGQLNAQLKSLTKDLESLPELQTVVKHSSV